MDVVELGGTDEPDARSRRRWPPVAAFVAVLALVAGAVVWTTADGDSGDARTEMDSVEPTLGGVAAATRDESSARVALRSRYGVGADTVLEGVMTFGVGGRGVFTAAPSTDDSFSLSEIRALPDATYLRNREEWIRFSNEDFTLDNGIRFPAGQNALLGTIELLLDLLDHADPATVRAIGTDVSGGDPVTVLEAEVDLLDAFRQGAEVVDEIAAGSVFADMEPEITVWVDDQARARLVRLAGDDETIEVELSEFGVDVDADAPTGAIDERTFADRADGEDSVETGGTSGGGAALGVCRLLAQRAAPAMISDPQDRVVDWSESRAEMYRLAEWAPAPAAEPARRLADAYRAVEDALGDGRSITQLIEQGVDTDEGLLDWEALLQIELSAYAAFDELCAYG